MKSPTVTAAAIVEARQNAKLTQQQAADLIGAAVRTWQDWEHGRRNMPAAKYALFLMLVKGA